MFERNLKDELFACHMYMKIPFDALMKMPVMDRKYYIHKYNEYMEERNAMMNGDPVSATADVMERFSNGEDVI